MGRLMKSIAFAGLVAVSLALGTASQASATPVGSVSCGSVNGDERRSAMAFSAISPAEGGYTLLIVEETGAFVLSLNQNLQVTEASSLEGQTLVPWNLVAYDGSPLAIAPSGDFSLEMMVSTRSACQFRGTATFLEGVETMLFN